MPSFSPKTPSRNNRVKTVFISAVLRETAERIREDQNRVVDEWDLFETGRVKSWLQGHFSVASTEVGGKLNMRYLTYYRFLDMADPRRKLRQAKRDGYHNYNKIVFGNLYNFGLPELKYGFTKEVHDMVTGEMDKAIMIGKNKYQRSNLMLADIADKDRFMAAILAKSLRKGY